MAVPIIPGILGLVLVILAPVAIIERRSGRKPKRAAVNAASPQPFAPPLLATREPARSEQCRCVSTGQVALGVWLGLWLFVLSVSVPAIAIAAALVESTRS